MEMENQEPTVTQKKTRPIISSGNVELDSRMGGGLPGGSLVLIEGGSGSGKSVLSQQIMYGALKDGFRVSLFTSESTVRSIVPQMSSIDMDILDFLLMRRMRVYPVEFSRIGEDATKRLFRAMTKEVKSDVIVVDSLTSAMTSDTDPSCILNFFEEAKRLCDTGKTVIVTVHPGGAVANFLDRLRSICDANLVLLSEADGQRMVKMLKVVKIRGAASVTGSIVGFEVEPGWGMRVIPISKARG